MEFWKHQPYAALELNKILVRLYVWRLVCQRSCKVTSAEDGMSTVLAHANINSNFSYWFFCNVISH